MDKSSQTLNSSYHATVETEETTQKRNDVLKDELNKELECLKRVIEKLETTNSELQLVNKELYTVNNEYQEKITQLSEANTDLDNVINSIDIGIVFLDEQLAIRKYTLQSTHYFNLRPSDIGHSIQDITHQLDYSEFFIQIAIVRSKNIIIERDILTKSGQAVLLKIMPHTLNEHTLEAKQGVLITITNISRLKFVENALTQAQEQFKSLLISRSERLHHRIEKNQNITVLVIDDDIIDRKIIKRYLKDVNEREYQIIESSGIDEAIAILQQKKIDVCLLDYQLSGNTAEDFSRALKSKKIDVPVILLSGQEESTMDNEFLMNEINDSIKKNDLSKPLLIRCIDYILERKEIRNIVQQFEV
ncbi:PAS domain-containing protein [Pseudocolwellia agarivorans]|uniref:PAS domain-containing protein n=1 Tax=Pseudocolwellia agarivorans TaxID=1911682 RepID=UPI0009846A21|nr:PAS domain-containing protein [Pseudocolwellia agarivorans]